MAKRQGGTTVTLSVLDRLIDQDPKNSSEAPLTRSQAERALKNGVRRDLEWLLNTRRVAVEPDESLRELNKSLYVYGLPDFSAYSVASPKDQGKLLRTLQTTLRLFEPRLINVQIMPLEGAAVGIQALRLRIEGMLVMDPAPEHVSFDTIIELKSGACQVRGDADAG
ncbi:MAG: type VI secretion system baseplate subunit TssE [Terriglobia bacterium]